MGLFKKNRDEKEKILSTSGAFIQGMLNYSRGTQCGIYANDTELKIQKLYDEKATTYHLTYDKIVNIQMLTETEIIQKSKSVIGGAVAGGLVLGPLGALIGGMAGTGTKQKKKTTYFMVINFISDSSNEVQILMFQVSPIFTEKLISYVQKHIQERLPGDVSL